MFDILWICLTYCIGSVPFGLVFAKTFCRIDPRTAGSGNVGGDQRSSTLRQGMGGGHACL